MTDDPLLKKARQAEDRAKRAKEEAAQARSEEPSNFALLNGLRQFFQEYAVPIGSTVSWGARKTWSGLKWASFEREDGDFKRDADGKMTFSRKRLGKVFAGVVGAGMAAHVALSAAYFYGTQFEELVYTTGKQEILTGELYQFTGCTSLPCSTDAKNGKFYEIEGSWYFPYSIYPEEDIYANIPQQDGACYAKGYGFYRKELKALHRSAQWYQKVYNISCRPYTEKEKERAVNSGKIPQPPEIKPQPGSGLIN